jgi:competence ComEA-like helix-hairpin-helix protein
MLGVILSAAKNLSDLSRRAGTSLGGCPMRRYCAWAFFALTICCVSLAALAQKEPSAKPLDINTASIEQLQQLPGVGRVIAQAIVDFRERGGPFRRVEELLAIRGISEARFKAIKPYVTVATPKQSLHRKLQQARAVDG